MSAIGGVGGVSQRVEGARAVVALASHEDRIGVRIDRRRGVLAAVDAGRATGERALRRPAGLAVRPRAADRKREFAALEPELAGRRLLGEERSSFGSHSFSKTVRAGPCP